MIRSGETFNSFRLRSISFHCRRRQGRWRPEAGRSCCARSRGPANDGSRRSVDGVMGNCRGLVSSKGRRGDESHPRTLTLALSQRARGPDHLPSTRHCCAYAHPFSPHPHSGQGEGCRGPHPHPRLLPSREKGPEPLPPTIAARTPKPPALTLILAKVRAAGGLTLILTFSPRGRRDLPGGRVEFPRRREPRPLRRTPHSGAR